MKVLFRFRSSRVFISGLLSVLLMFAVLAAIVPILRRPIRANRVTLLDVEKRYPKFTREQRMAVLREMQTELHPRFRDLSMREAAERLLRIAASVALGQPDTGAAPLADFVGNQTIVAIPQTDLLALSRQADCSLTLRDAQYTLALPVFSYVLANSVPGYEKVLHNAAGLATTGGKFPAGCGDPTLGLSSRKIVYLGKTTTNRKVFAGTFYDSLAGAQAIFTVVAQADDTYISNGEITGFDSQSVTTADLNKDGNGDLVSINAAESNGAASLTVMLGNTDGSLQTAVNYTLPGTASNSSVVIDDFNGDGVPDIVAATSDTNGYDINFLAGKGDGSFKAVATATVKAPKGFAGLNPYGGLVSADLRNSGKKDLVTHDGIVLLGNGDGTFIQQSALAFVSGGQATSSYGPNIAAADLNKDGKIDLALDNGGAIQIYLGNGDATFKVGASYATTNNAGYITATDIDGDGNVDLFSGLANGATMGGDQFDYGEAYALMGNGDGTFRGANDTPFVFTGTNVVDLNGDGKLDGVGVNATLNSSNVSFTSYLGNGDGTFSAKATLLVSPVTIGGKAISFSSIDSFGFGDINGDGIQDLVYISSNFGGYYVATGNGDGSFNTPTYTSAPSLVPNGDDNLFVKQTNTVFVADFNHDGKADILYSYVDQGNSSQIYYQGFVVQLSKGDGTFEAPQLIQTYSGTTAPAGSEASVGLIADPNVDEIPDLFVVGSTTTANPNASLLLYLGKGDGTFAAPATLPVSGGVSPILFGSVLAPLALADMNGDGHPDLVAISYNATPSGLNILLGKGDGTFATPFVLPCYDCGGLGEGVAVADFTGSGKMDVAVTNFMPPYDTGIFTGNGDGTVNGFTPAGGGLAQPALGIGLLVYGGAMTADFNGDGKPDLLAGNAILLGTSASTTLTATTTTLTAEPNPAGLGESITFTAVIAPASGSGTPTGTVTFYDGTTELGTGTLSAGSATYSTGSLTAGKHSITANYGSNSTYAASTSAAVSVVVSATALTATTTTLTSSAASLAPGGSVTLTAVVAGPSGTTAAPTGTVTFLDGTTTLGTGTLNGSATATYTTTALPAGTDSITAEYSGDSAFAASTSSTTSIFVGVQPTFSLALSPAALSIASGGKGTTIVTATSAAGFASAITFACTGLPANSSCAFSPASVTPGGSAPVTSTLTIATNVSTASLGKVPSPHSSTRLPALLCLAFFGAFGLIRFGRVGKALSVSRSAMLTIVWSALLASAIGAATGCGGSHSSKTPSGASTVTVSATGGSQTETATLTLTVQ